MKRVKVMVSPFYGGEEWIDEGTGILFKQNRMGDAAIYTIPQNANFSGIRKAIQLNTLFLVEGSIDDLTGEAPEKVEAPVEETKEIVEAPVVEEKVEEAPKEEKVEAPKTKKKSTKK